MRRPVFLALIAVLALAPAAHAGTIILNGSFELGTGAPGGGYVTLGTGNTSIQGWTVSSGTVEWIGTYWQAADGVRSLDLNGNSPGSIASTAFTTVEGQQYLLTFSLAGNPDGGPTVKEVWVSVAGLEKLFSFDVTGKSKTNMGWTNYSLYFTAIDDSTTLSFRSNSLDPRYYGAALDNVDVTAVPEPMSVLLVGTGLVGVARKLRRRA
jgi:choice-of-anchor C domain-containing protein